MLEADGVPIAEAAARLGLSQEAARKRIQRGTLQGVKHGREWFVVLPAGDGSERPDASETVRTAAGQASGHEDGTTTAVLQAQVESLTRENERLAAALERSQDSLQRSQQGEAELRRLLAAEQQKQLPAPLEVAASMPLEAPESHESAPVDVAPVQTPAALEQTLKQAGVKGKKVRRRVAEAFAVLFGR
jgi:hypothetical protein